MRSIYAPGRSPSDKAFLKCRDLIEDLDRGALSLASLISFGTGSSWAAPRFHNTTNTAWDIFVFLEEQIETRGLAVAVSLTL